MDDLETFARTLYGEARGEPVEDIGDVAAVIMNRFRNPRWWSRNRDDIPDDTIAAVCRDPWQFSCWNANDPNRAKLLAVGKTDPLYVKCETVARAAMEGRLFDRTNRADHYLTHAALRATPPRHWARLKPPVYSNRSHVFFRLELAEAA